MQINDSEMVNYVIIGITETKNFTMSAQELRSILLLDIIATLVPSLHTE